MAKKHKINICNFTSNDIISKKYNEIKNTDKCDICLIDEKTILKKKCDYPILLVKPPVDKETLYLAVQNRVKAILPYDCNERTLFDIVSDIKKEIENRDKLLLLNQYKKIVDEDLIVSKTDINGNITYVNEAFEKISGFTKKELLGKNHNIIRHPDMKNEVFKDLWNTILNKKTWKGIIKNRKKDGSAYYVEGTIKPILDSHGNIKEFIALRKDITHLMNPEKIINDKLKFIDEALLIFVKIDNYSDLQVVYNEEILQKLKRRLLNRVKNFLRGFFIESVMEYYEIEKDIFAFLIQNFDKEALDKIFQEVVTEIGNHPLIINGFEYYPLIKISYGYGKNHLFKNVSIALTELDNENKVIFANGICERKKREVIKNMNILKKINYAIKNNKIISLYQPIIDNKTKKTIKYESLVRIIDENGEILSPGTFLDVAKKAGLYGKIGIKVLENTFEEFRIKKIPLSINISPNDIMREFIRERIYELLDYYKPKTGEITFEILEDEIILFPALIKDFIKNVKKYNAQISIDDFGSGYSNFSRIMELNADIIKIDGSLVLDIDKDVTKQTIVESIVHFAKKENKITIAEFVENEQIYKTVTDLGVDWSQGYYFSKPLKGGEVDEIYLK